MPPLLSKLFNLRPPFSKLSNIARFSRNFPTCPLFQNLSTLPPPPFSKTFQHTPKNFPKCPPPPSSFFKTFQPPPPFFRTFQPPPFLKLSNSPPFSKPSNLPPFSKLSNISSLFQNYPTPPPPPSF